MISLPSRQRLDPTLVILPVALSLLGVLLVGSATGSLLSSWAVRQFVYAVVGVGMGVAMARNSYRALAERAKLIYAANLALLVIVMVAGDESKGAQRWIDLGLLSLQPSELAKLALIVTLAVHLTKEAADLSSLRVLGRTLLHLGPPWLLIFKQPDLGTSLVLLAIWFAMTAVAGARIKHLVCILFVGLALFGVMWKANVIKPYQKARLAILWDPSIDVKGEGIGYHIQQSRIAIGSGRETGKGLFAGTQKKLRFVPERHTDFIFTVIGEELGFAGSAVLLLLYWMLIMAGLRVCLTCEDLLGQLMAAGVVAMLTFHTIVNIGMTMGIMPVTGVPLPFLSYGGSSMLANSLAIGLLISIHVRRYKITF